MKSDKELEKQLESTKSLHQEYTLAKDKLREIFYDTYDQATIVSLIVVLQKYGHPVEQTFAKTFEKDYKSNNFDEVEIEMFKSFLKRYQEQVLKHLNEKE